MIFALIISTICVFVVIAFSQMTLDVKKWSDDSKFFGCMGLTFCFLAILMANGMVYLENMDKKDDMQSFCIEIIKDDTQEDLFLECKQYLKNKLK